MDIPRIKTHIKCLLAKGKFKNTKKRLLATSNRTAYYKDVYNASSAVRNDSAAATRWGCGVMPRQVQLTGKCPLGGAAFLQRCSFFRNPFRLALRALRVELQSAVHTPRNSLFITDMTFSQISNNALRPLLVVLILLGVEEMGFFVDMVYCDSLTIFACWTNGRKWGNRQWDRLQEKLTSVTKPEISEWNTTDGKRPESKRFPLFGFRLQIRFSCRVRRNILNTYSLCVEFCYRATIIRNLVRIELIIKNKCSVKLAR